MLHAADEVHERRHQARHPATVEPELVGHRSETSCSDSGLAARTRNGGAGGVMHPGLLKLRQSLIPVLGGLLGVVVALAVAG